MAKVWGSLNCDELIWEVSIRKISLENLGSVC